MKTYNRIYQHWPEDDQPDQPGREEDARRRLRAASLRAHQRVMLERIANQPTHCPRCGERRAA